MTDKEFQLQLLENLRTNAGKAYKDASVHTLLLDLVDDQGIKIVFYTLHLLATEFDLREDLEALFDEMKEHEWT